MPWRATNRTIRRRTDAKRRATSRSVGAGEGTKRRPPSPSSMNTPCATKVWKWTLTFSADPKRWMAVTAPPAPPRIPRRSALRRSKPSTARMKTPNQHERPAAGHSQDLGYDFVRRRLVVCVIRVRQIARHGEERLPLEIEGRLHAHPPHPLRVRQRVQPEPLVQVIEALADGQRGGGEHHGRELLEQRFAQQRCHRNRCGVQHEGAAGARALAQLDPAFYSAAGQPVSALFSARISSSMVTVRSTLASAATQASSGRLPRAMLMLVTSSSTVTCRF